MASTGSLIPMHSHSNKNVLDKLSEDEKKRLMYDGHLLDARVSALPNNLVELKDDGLFVQGELLSRFSYKDGVLYFNGITVSQEYDPRAITLMVRDVWDEIDGEDETE